MGVYEIITGITKNEENLKVEIRQTEGTLERNLVYIKNTKTNRAYSFTLADGDEYGADAMTRNAVAKLHSDMYGCNEKTLDRIEHALGIKLETWQSEYILSQGITYPHEGTDTLIFGLQAQRNCDRREVRKVEYVCRLCSRCD